MNIYDIVFKTQKGEDATLAPYRGKVLLIVNTATGCGLTPQYEALEQTYRTYRDRGFEVLDFPCNQFMEQAKGSDDEINSFCTLRYSTSFPRFRKVDVNGPSASPLFAHLKAERPTDEGAHGAMNLLIRLSSFFNGKSKESADIKWNFTKFLVDRQGHVVARFAPTATPEQIAPAIEAIL